MQLSGNYYTLIFVLAIHMGVAISFLVGYRTSITTVRTYFQSEAIDVLATAFWCSGSLLTPHCAKQIVSFILTKQLDTRSVPVNSSQEFLLEVRACCVA